MQQADIVEHHKIAVVEAETDLEGLILQHVIEHPAGAVVFGQRLGAHQRHEVEARADVHALHLPARIQHDRRRTGDQLRRLVLEAIAHGRLAQHLERRRIGGAQGFRRRRAVGQGRQAARGLVGQAVQQLHPRHRGAVRIVRMRPKLQRRIGEVVGAGDGADIKHVAKIRVADVTKGLAHPDDGPVRRRHAAEEDESVFKEGLHPVETRLVRRLLFPVSPGQIGQIAGPEGALGRVVIADGQRDFAGQGRRIEHGIVGVAEADAEAPAAEIGHGFDRQIERQVRRVIEALAGAEVDFGRRRAAFAQPDRVDSDTLAIRPLRGQSPSLFDHQCRRGPPHSLHLRPQG